MNTRLPTLIFGEVHNDTTTKRIVGKLTSRLKDLGYHTFFKEWYGTTSIDDMINQFLPACEKLVATLAYLSNLDHVQNQNEILQLFDPDLLKIGIFKSKCDFDPLFDALPRERKKQWYETVDMPPNKFVDMVEDATTYLYHLRSLQNNNIENQNIDSEICEEIAGLDESDSAVINTIPVRDACMANAYANSQNPVFGIIGRAHLMGIQRNLAELLTPKQVEEKFLFFHLYDSSIKFINEDSFVTEVEAGTLQTPFPVRLFNHNSKSDEEIIAEILGMITQKAKLRDEATVVTPLRQQSVFSSIPKSTVGIGQSYSPLAVTSKR